MARKKLLTEGEVRQFMKLANLGALSENYFTNNPLEEESEEEEIHDLEGDLDHEDHVADDEGDELDAMDLEGDGDNEALLARVVQAVADELGVEVDVEGGEEGGEELEADVDMMDDGDVEMMDMAVEEEPGGRDMYEEAQSADAREDEHLGAEDGPESGKKQSEKDRRKEMRGARRAAGESGDPVATQEGQEIEEVFGGVTSTRHPQRRKSAVAQNRELRKAAMQKCADKGWHWEDGECHEPGEAGASDPLAGLGEELDQEAVVAEVARRVAERLNADKQKEELASQLAERIFQRLTAK